MTPSHNMGVDSGIQLNLKGWNVTAEGALIVMQRTRRIKSHLSTLISSISQPTERADNVKRGCRTQSFCAVKTSEGAASQRQDRRGGGGWSWGTTTEKWRNKKGQIGDLKFLSVCGCTYRGSLQAKVSWSELVRACGHPSPTPPLPSLFSRGDESVPSCPINGSIDLYIHAHAGGARWWCTDTEPKANLFGWLTSPAPPLLPLPVCFYSTQWNFSSAKPVTVTKRQPVLSVLSAPAFSRLAEILCSLLHQYPFIAIAIVFYDSWERGAS